MLVFLIALAAVLAESTQHPCGDDNLYPNLYGLTAADAGAALRFSERGLEKFCQMGFTILPRILASFPPYTMKDPMTIAGVRFKLKNAMVRSCELNTFRLSFTPDDRFRISVDEGLLTISFDIDITIIGLTGSLHSLISLNRLSGVVEAGMQDDPLCLYRCAPNLDNALVSITYDSFNVDMQGLDAIGNTVAGMIKGMHSFLDGLIRNSLLPLISESILGLVSKMISNGAVVSSPTHRSVTDGRYAETISIRNGKTLANWPGYTYYFITNQTTGSYHLSNYYLATPPAIPPRDLYTNKDFELAVDKTAFNSMYYAINRNSAELNLELEITEQMVNEVLSEYQPSNGALFDPLKGAILRITPSADPVVDKIYPVTMTTLFQLNYRLQLADKNGGAGNVHESPFQVIAFTRIDVGHQVVNPFATRLYAVPIFTDIAALDRKSNVALSEDVSDDAFDVLLRYIVRNQLFSQFNRVMSDTTIQILNANFLDYSSVYSVFFPTDEKVVILANVTQNPIFAYQDDGLSHHAYEQ
ncbi:hypothetical protein GMRT_12355 [Giardia muris]|uniref:BPI-like protein n=1 Tax=Giardia muris TaxID=5742 RepID=A0A4Z1T421_GIAMU|nr:hypothetical protein GMRT_12355 [Giardia muris]|eukprot:TNJ27289.1 hypothetical protein GMRT_12355 [Giardia muris]